MSLAWATSQDDGKLAILPRRTRGVQIRLAPLYAPARTDRQLVFAALLGLFLGWTGMLFYDWPLWITAGLTLGRLVMPSAGEWRADQRRYGRSAMGVSFLLMTQSFHTIEHLVHWYQ